MPYQLDIVFFFDSVNIRQWTKMIPGVSAAGSFSRSIGSNINRRCDSLSGIIRIEVLHIVLVFQHGGHLVEVGEDILQIGKHHLHQL